MMASAVYLLCALTSVACAFLVYRSYRRNRVKLLLLTTICFVALAVNNILLVIDLVVFMEKDLSVARSLTALAGIVTLLFGLIWEDAA